MELAAVSSKGIRIDDIQGSTELSPTGAEKIQNAEADDEMSSLVASPSSPFQSRKSNPEIFIMFEGFWLILRSPYLIYISLFLWLSAVISSFFYFQKVTIIATTISSPAARRRTFALINSFIAVFILAGQLTLTVFFPCPNYPQPSISMYSHYIVNESIYIFLLPQHNLVCQPS
jgi:AAA family ATP:ADP antiporter